MPALQKIMLEFARENERSELTGELIGDTLDDALADDGDAEAEDKIVSQVTISSPKETCFAWSLRTPGDRVAASRQAETYVSIIEKKCYLLACKGYQQFTHSPPEDVLHPPVCYFVWAFAFPNHQSGATEMGSPTLGSQTNGCCGVVT